MPAFPAERIKKLRDQKQSRDFIRASLYRMQEWEVRRKGDDWMCEVIPVHLGLLVL